MNNPSITEENVTNSRGEFINIAAGVWFSSALLTFGTILAPFVIYFGSQYIELLSVLKNSGFIQALLFYFDCVPIIFYSL